MERTLTMMLETEAGSGEYEMVTQNNWPTDGYVFNANLSTCENGGELAWDDENKLVTMTGGTSDKCYVYFDIYEPLYKITYPTFSKSKVSGISEAKAGDIVTITIDFGDNVCDGNRQIMGFPMSITDMICDEDFYKYYTISDGKINGPGADVTTCQFTMPAENVEFTNIQDASRCMT